MPGAEDTRVRAADLESVRSTLRETEERFQLLVESVEDYAIFMLDPEGHVQTWNVGAERIKGYAADEIVGKHFSTFYSPEDAWKCDVELATASERGRVEDEGWRVRKDGTRFWANVVITALRRADGELVGFAKVTRDMTERMAAEELVRASEERLRLLIDSVQDYAIFMLDTEGRVQTWNRGAERITGWTRKDIAGKHYLVLFSPEDVDGRAARELEIARDEGRVEEEGWRVRKDGSRFWANVVLTALRDARGQLVGFAKVTRDLTERLRVEEERIRLAQAEEANRTKDEFLATISHELRTPLNAILGWSVLLGERVSDPTVAKALAAIRRNAEAQTRIIEDILDVSRIVIGKLRIEPRPVDFASVVREAVDVVRPAADAKDIAIVAEGTDLPAQTVGDPTRLSQAVWNVLSNAVKFSGGGGRIDVRLVRSPTTLELTVRDRGVGIAPTVLPHVFERFRQADSSSTRKHGGLGLGLSIVLHVVEQHGGTITAASEGVGKGATFTMTIPVRAQKTSGVSPAVFPSLEGKPLADLSILVVEDDMDTRELVELVLEHAGAVVRTAGRADEARQMLAERRPDVVISDIAMPDEDGYDFVRSLRNDPDQAVRALPVIAMTAYAHDVDRARAIAAGFDMHLPKPLNPHEIVRIVSAIVHR